MSLTSGKVNLLGIYSGDIGIPQAGQVAGQLVFHFVVHCDLAERPDRLTLEVTLPGNEPKSFPVSVAPSAVASDRKRWAIQVPFPILLPRLQPGRIDGRVLFDGAHPVSIRGPWITLNTPPPVARV
jgi:hypothetical protein